jgi:hypothetical protein
MSDPWTQLLRDLETIRRLDAGVAHTCADQHTYVLNPPLAESEVVLFETEHKISLPQDYREFLLLVGNGGVGPSYGVQKLGEMDGIPWSELPGLVGELSQPFPYTDAWNDNSDCSSLPIEEQYRRQDEYWSSRHVNGAIPICHHGCNLRECLIVTGAERGNMWFDDRPDWQGLYPSTIPIRNRITFFEWYRSWLDSRLANVNS